MKKIRICDGLYTLVSDEDYPHLSQYNWCAKVRTKHLVYVYRYERLTSRKYRQVKMHRQIIDAPSHLSVDHINGNPLDNRRENLRLATQQQQAMNTHKRASAQSRYKGVSRRGLVRHKYQLKKPWVARIRLAGKLITLGYFLTEYEAAYAYDSAARMFFGEFAALNGVEATR